MRMWQRWTPALVAAALVVVAAPAAIAGEKDKGSLAIGAAVPSEVAEVEMKNVDGETVSIADATGEKGTLVIFSCNGCPWVVAWEERIVALGNDFRAKGIGVIVINSNDPGQAKADGFEEMQKRALARGMKFPYVMDATSKVARAFGATRTPEAFLFDAKGKLVYHGTIDDNARKPEEVENHYLKDALYAVSTGKKVKTAETKALGCSIKFRKKSVES